MPRAKRKAAFLNLWSVEVRHTGDTAGSRFTTSLWITTPSERVEQALKKSETFCKRNFVKAEIRKIEYRGYIDA